MITYINHLDKITSPSISINLKYIHIPTNVFDQYIIMFKEVIT